MAFRFLLRQSLVLGVQGAPRAPLPKLNAHHIMWLGPAAKHVAWEAPVIGQRLLHAKVKSSQAAKAYQNLFNDRAQGPVVEKVKALFKQSIPYAGVLRHETSVWGQKILMKLRIIGIETAYTSTRAWGHAMIAKRLPPLQSKVQDSLQRLKQQVPVLRNTGYQRGYSHGGTTDPNTVLYGLIAANVAVWLLWQVPALQPFMQKHLLASVDSIMSLRLHTAITANFSHSDAKHLALNMISLYFFGQSVGYQYGGKALLGLYLAGGIGCITSYCLYYTVYVPWKEGYSRRFYDARRTPPCQGASGSVNTILICSILSAPFRTIYLNFIIPVPAIALGALVIYSDLSGAIGRDYASRVGYSGHLGGAAVGMAAWAYFRRFRFR